MSKKVKHSQCDNLQTLFCPNNSTKTLKYSFYSKTKDILGYSALKPVKVVHLCMKKLFCRSIVCFKIWFD